MNMLSCLIASLGFEILRSVFDGMIIYLIFKLLSHSAFGMTPSQKSILSLSGLLLLILLFFKGVIPLMYRFDLKQLPFKYSPLDSISHENSLPFSHQQPGLLLLTLGFLYCVSVVFSMLKLLFSYCGLISLKRSFKITPPKAWENSLTLLLKKLDVARKVSLYCSESINTPVLYGYLKPVILIPASFISQFNLFEIEYILVHELKHIKRKDYLVQIIVNVVQIILFLNPFTHLLMGEFYIERENDCDDKVVTINNDPVAYAKTLLKLAEYRKYGNCTSTLHINANNNQLLNRIKRITVMEKSNKNHIASMILGTAFLAIFTLISWSSKTIKYESFERRRVVHSYIELKHGVPLKIEKNTAFLRKRISHNFKVQATGAISGNEIKVADTSVTRSLESQIVDIRKTTDSIKTIFNYENPDFRKTFKALDTLNSLQWANQKSKLKAYYKHLGSIFSSKQYQDNLDEFLKKSDGKIDGYYLNQ